MDRSQEIIRTSWIGIVANVLLAGFKAAVGILASSVAIVMDAINNLSDALSSVITIVGTKLSQRPADRKAYRVFQRHHHCRYYSVGRYHLAHRIGEENLRPYGARIHYDDTGGYCGGHCGKTHPRPVCEEEGRTTEE